MVLYRLAIALCAGSPAKNRSADYYCCAGAYSTQCNTDICVFQNEYFINGLLGVSLVSFSAQLPLVQAGLCYPAACDSIRLSLVYLTRSAPLCHRTVASPTLSVPRWTTIVSD